jgi:hypothetical protein
VIRWRRALIPVLALALGLITAAPALATFHLIKVREVFPGPGDHTGFVELQMYEEGQNELTGHSLTVYDAAGELIHTSTFQEGVPNAVNQSTVLIGEAEVGTLLRVVPDLVDPDLNLPAAGGAVCWNADGTPADCVSWGNFHGNQLLPSPAGAPADPGGIVPGHAILRRITPGCSTLLEPSDDADNSATDFTVLLNSPNPRNNATPPTERTCPGLPPDTSIDDHPDPRTNSRTATFTYGAPTATKFKCKLDAAPFGECAATGRTFTNVADGTHTFSVFGENASAPDPTPATFTWTVDTVAPTTTIDTQPADPSPGQSAAFTFHASEATLKFECSLAAQGGADAFSSCASPRTFNELADGTYTFKVRATDLAGNPQATPSQFTWRVDNVVADTTPPETTITTKPPDPSTSANAVFGYSSNEAGSSFECALDGAPFAACAATGITFNGLGNGPHTFLVRAIDPSKNVDQSAAAYTFSVAVVNEPPREEPPKEEPPVAPQTSLVGKPLKRTSDRTPSFRFRASVAGASFQCAVDRGRFKACRSPFTTPSLRPGRHTFTVKAVASGLTDPSPLRVSFQVLKKRTR